MRRSKLLNPLLAAALLMTTTLYANHQHESTFDFVKKDAVTIDRTSSFELDMTPAKALPLFTAIGEILWAPGWQPNILSGDGFEEGTIWVTKHDNSTTYWHVSKYNTQLNEAIYTFVTPDLVMGTVKVVLSDNSKKGSVVKITYNLTALSTKGNQKLRSHYSKDHYPKMIAEWKMLIMKNMKKIKSVHK